MNRSTLALVGARIILGSSAGLITGASSGLILGVFAGYEGQNLLGCCGIIWSGAFYGIYGVFLGAAFGALNGIAVSTLVAIPGIWIRHPIAMLVMGITIGTGLGWFIGSEATPLFGNLVTPTDRMQRHAKMTPTTAVYWCVIVSGIVAGAASGLVELISRLYRKII